MPVLIGSARINEFGDVYGGQPGDQTGKECAVENWYRHEYGWIVIRAKDAAARAKIAQDMRYICANENIGYDWDRMYTLTQQAAKYGYDASKVTVKCDTNCAKAVRICILYAGINCDDFYTGDEIGVLSKTGKFDIIRDPKYTNSSDYLLQGDILVTPVQGHTVVVLTDGPKVKTVPYKVIGDVWMRKGPGTQYDKIIIPPKEFVPKNAIVHVMSMHYDDTWAYCVYEGNKGYCSHKYLTPATHVYKVEGDVHVRKNPGVWNASIGILEKDILVEGTGRSASVLGTPWYEVRYLDQTGWSSGKLLEKCT